MEQFVYVMSRNIKNLSGNSTVGSGGYIAADFGGWHGRTKRILSSSGRFFASEKTERSNRKESFLMEKYILTDTVNGVHVSKDLQEVLTKAEDDVKNGRVAAIGKTFTELRNMLQEN